MLILVLYLENVVFPKVCRFGIGGRKLNKYYNTETCLKLFLFPFKHLFHAFWFCPSLPPFSFTEHFRAVQSLDIFLSMSKTSNSLYFFWSWSLLSCGVTKFDEYRLSSGKSQKSDRAKAKEEETIFAINYQSYRK